jgi:coenzyme F420-reducing hydrogenase beta subunit
MQFDAYGFLKPAAKDEWYNKPSAAFSRTCPFSPGAATEDLLMQELFPDAQRGNFSTGRFQKAYVGHVSEDEYRSQGSSGGMTTWVATELMRKGLIDGVAHVVATESPQTEARYFHYRISRTEAEIREGAKSRYYPIELSEILQLIKDVPGRYAVIGIPCFVKAVQLLRKEDPVFRERIRFTLGLFCGHMKSARFVESFAWQMNIPAPEIQQVEFRHKDPQRPAYIYNAMLRLRNGRVVNKEWENLADGDWGAGFFMNSACNFCDDVVAETADISFGDAWVEPYASDGKGTNVVVIRSQLISTVVSAAIAEGRLCLQEVNDEFIEKTQRGGLRQRREGLAYRLTWAPGTVQPLKRVAPNATQASGVRKLIYRLRYMISVWSHRMFWLARKFNKPAIYLLWAKAVKVLYQKITFYRPRLVVLLFGMRATAFSLLINLILFGSLRVLNVIDTNNFMGNAAGPTSIWKVLIYSLIIPVCALGVFIILPRFTSKPVLLFNIIYPSALIVLLLISLSLNEALTTSLLYYIAPTLLLWRYLLQSSNKKNYA